MVSQDVRVAERQDCEIAAGERDVWLVRIVYTQPRAMVAPLAVELAPRRIRVNAVLPGAIETPAFAKLGLAPEQLGALGEWLRPRLLVGRPGNADDVARVVAFLLSPAAAYVNGACLPIDGGLGVS